MKKFSKNDEGFVCLHCNREVKPLVYSSRNHCPYCLYSLHVDNNPGDRANDCRGLMKPIGIVFEKKGKIIVHQCEKCKAIKRNISANDDSEQQILNVMKNS